MDKYPKYKLYKVEKYNFTFFIFIKNYHKTMYKQILLFCTFCTLDICTQAKQTEIHYEL